MNTSACAEVAAVLRLGPGDCHEVSIGSSGFRAHPVWDEVVAQGLASARLVGATGAERLLVRRAGPLPVVSPRPPSACGLCGRDSVPERLRLPEMRVGICPECGAGLVLEYTGGLGADEPDSYSERYTEESHQGKAQACWEMLLQDAGGVQGARSVLDVGCGAGAFLGIARAHGLDTAGTELAPQAAAEAIAAGHEVLCCSAEQRAFAAGRTFDLVTMWDILEHLQQPRLALANAVEALAPGGRLVIATPMMGSAFDRWGMRLARLPALRLRQLARMCWTRDHVYRFDRHGTAEVMRRLGCAGVTTAPVLLLSLHADRYAGGRILRSWTGVQWADRVISRAGVRLVSALRVSNKALIVAEKPGQTGPAAPRDETRSGAPP